MSWLLLFLRDEGDAAALRRFVAVAIMIVGGLVFAGESSNFASFSYCAVPGTTILASTFFFLGVALWLNE